MSRTRTARVYLQIVDKRPHGGGWRLDATVRKATTHPPTSIEPGCIVVPVELTIPQSRFATTAPPVVVEVPDVEPVEGEVTE